MNVIMMDLNRLGLFAFGFASPWLLLGLGLGAIPIVVHLLHKRRFRETDWAAMRFLLEAARKNSRRLRLEQLLLLLVRVLIFVLLICALAQPYAESLGTFVRSEAPTHRIVVIDASFSMGYRSADQSRFERAKDIARKIIDSAKQGDALNLVRICDSHPRTIVRRPSYQQSTVVGEIDRLELTDERGDLAATLQEVVELLTQASKVEQKQVYLISDLQRESWGSGVGGTSFELRRLFKQISESARLMIIDLGRPRSANASVTSLTVDEPFVIADRAVHLQTTIKNFGPSPLVDQRIELYVDGRLTETRSENLAPASDVPVKFTYTFERSGEHRIDVRLPDDFLATDNRRWLALPVRDELNVLLVNGKRSGRAPDNATFYLEKAFAPSTSKRKWTGVTRPKVIKDGELIAHEDLSRYDCIFLCNVGTFEPREAEILRAYLQSGGGVVFCLGDQVRPENYNRVLYQDGQGILPARLGDRADAANDPQRVFQFDVADLKHPIVNPFEGNPGTGLDQALTTQYVRVEPRPDSTTVALQFTSGDPAIVDAVVGHGRSILLTMSVDTAWGGWPVQRSFPPIMHEIVRYAVTGRWEERQRLVGEAVTRIFPTRAFSVPVRIRRPDNRQIVVPLFEEENFASISYRETTRRGVYEVILGVPLGRSELFAVNVDSRESDLRKLSEKQLQTELLADVEFEYRTRWQDFARSTDAMVSEQGHLTRWLLIATFCLVLVEQLMAWNFYFGFLLLYSFVAFAFVRQTLAWHPAGAVIVALVLAAGLFVILHQRRQRMNAGV